MKTGIEYDADGTKREYLEVLCDQFAGRRAVDATVTVENGAEEGRYDQPERMDPGF